MSTAPGSRPSVLTWRQPMLRRRVVLLVAAFLALVGAVALVPPPSAQAAVPWADLPAHLDHIGASTQVVVVTSSSWSTTYATLRAYEKKNGTWRLVMGPWKARVGYSGMTPASERVQGDGTTPAGTFRMTSAFGIQPDPGTDLPYWRIRSRDQWWVGDRKSAHYNEPRWGRDGGFRRTTTGIDGSERLADYPTQYAYAAVIDFNRPDPVVGRGSGIFLHVNGRGSTAGCVSLTRANVVKVLRWLDPAKRPRITIAPASVVTKY
ncbi:L,D-transpeptidase [Kineosporia sp. R_H_3]|uniref:L,D-transpeptidase family protein n=1 Tax=Kineosporia sp. R_H_3 TaxID=1961848 RepID=UPI0018EA1EA9|nr:L,D-transpeptidase family protein [Kineosporia sp. R_H_3]